MTAAEFRLTVGNQFFSAEFFKKDGTIRLCNGRMKVQKHLKGGESTHKEHPENVVYFDMVKKAYRCFNVNNLVKVNGVTV